MERSKHWEDERYLFEKLKQEKLFRRWKKEQFDSQRGKCGICKKPMQYRYTETDHILPLYYGGTSEASNLMLCHHSCNMNKSVSIDYRRPEWIKPNSLSQAVTDRYLYMKNELLGDSTRANHLITPSREITINNSHPSKLILIFIIGITVFTIIASAIMLVRHKNVATDKQPISTNNSATKPIRTKDDDDERRQLAQLLLAEYGTYFDYWVTKKGYKLPKDSEDCTSWNGCALSFPYGQVRTADGFSYSINSLNNEAIYTPTGELPNATKDNAALYKRARCGENGSVIGGNIDRNAAAVIQLSDGSYYCVQN